MVKRLKRFIVFCLFSLFFALLSGKVQKGENNKKDGNLTWNSASADRCCTNGVDADGNCY